MDGPITEAEKLREENDGLRAALRSEVNAAWNACAVIVDLGAWLQAEIAENRREDDGSEEAEAVIQALEMVDEKLAALTAGAVESA